MKDEVCVRVPVRIDLTGGSLDIYPLYNFFWPEKSSTINMAISLYNYIHIRRVNLSNKIKIISGDEIVELTLNDINNKKYALFVRTAIFFNISDIEIILKSEVPNGSGLGNSSSIIIGLIIALSEITGKKVSDNIIEIAQGIETSLLKIPTGKQDYLAALNGGVNMYSFNILGTQIHRFELSNKFENEILNYITLCYSHLPDRYSNPVNNPNWDLFKRIVEKDDSAINALNEIRNLSQEMYNALLNEDIKRVIDILIRETKQRIKLSPKIYTKQMKNIVDTAENLGIFGFKICGAGGGGCMLLMTENQDNLNKKINKIIPFSIDKQGAVIVDCNF